MVNEREDDHFITTGFFDSACRDLIASPLHYLLMRELEQAAGGAGKTFSLFLAESYWGREQYLSRLGVVPYNSALFKICERVAQGTSPVSEIYHLYEDHYRHALAPGTELMSMLGNHDERRPVNTFGRDNLRPVLTLTSFLTNLLLDYEGNAEGEAWKVFADNVYVDWNRFDSAADRSVERVFSEVYAFHRRNPGRGTLVPTDHEQVAAAIKPVTRGYAHYTGRELRVTPLTTSVSYRQRVKLLRIDLAGEDSSASELLRDSFDRLLAARSREQVAASFAYRALADAAASRDRLLRFLDETLLPLYDAAADEAVAVGLKRALYHAHREAGARTGTGAGLGHLHGGALPAAARAGGVLARALDLLRSRPGRVRVGGGGAVLQERRSGQRHVRTAPRAGPSRRVDVRDHAAVPQRGRTGGGQDAGRGGAVRRDLHRRDRALSAWRRRLRGRRAPRGGGGGDLLPARPP